MANTAMSPLPDFALDEELKVSSRQQPFEALFKKAPANWEALSPAGAGQNGESSGGNEWLAGDELAPVGSELGLEGLGDPMDMPDAFSDSAELSDGGMYSPEMNLVVADTTPTMSVADHEAAITELERQHAEQLEAIRHEKTEELVTSFLATKDELFSQCSASIETAVATALAPLCGVVLNEIAVGQLAEELRGIVAGGAAGKLVISGPEALLDQVRNSLGEHASHFEFCQQDDHQLFVEIDDVVIATCVERWTAQLAVNAL